ncbi:hypothetical protein [Nocardia beijingensis]|uniref:Uncharacterized protein n=1 Tax=Nocardia beijingensis TaxID=95162 RepID=A0ABW7WLV6_9NOCA
MVGLHALRTGSGYWTAATWTTSLWFIPQLITVAAAMAVIYPDRNEPPVGCYLAISALGALIGVGLTWSSSPGHRGVALGVVTASSVLLCVPALRLFPLALPLAAIWITIASADEDEGSSSGFGRASFAGCSVAILVNAVPLIATAYYLLFLYAFVLAAEAVIVAILLLARGRARQFGTGVAISWLGLGVSILVSLPVW